MMMPKWSREYMPALVLSGLVAVLSILATLEWAWLQPGQLQGHNRPDNRPSSGAGVVADEDSPGFELPELEAFAATVEHPLFAENRLPPAEEALDAATPLVSTPLTLKLMGLIFTPRQQTALMQDAKGKYKRLHRNDSLDGWTLVALSGDRVTLQQGGEQKELILLKPRPKPPTAQVPHPKTVAQDTDNEDSGEAVDNAEDTSGEDVSDEDTEATGD
jgi:hypothetical protein